MKANKHWLDKRWSGVLAHITSLPSEFGVGNLGSGARRFIDSLNEGGFSHWQICPVGPTGYGDSPYQSFSSFAGNPYMIDLNPLIEAGYIEDEWVEPLRDLPDSIVDYGALYRLFWNVLGLAKERFDEHPSHLGFQSYEEFVAQEADWLEPYSLFMALKAQHSGAPWHLWDEECRTWDKTQGYEIPKETLQEQGRQKFYQYCFYQQWHKLMSYAHSKDIQIIGDIPIFVSYDSADCWKNPELFTLDDEGQQLQVAGVPPDYFSDKGQLWGNPLYDWDLHDQTGYDWWITRIKHSFRIYDVIRLDHFRGFDSYWSIPSDAEDARVGEWKYAPGEKLFAALEESFPGAKLIAEDLGYITQGVYDLRVKTGLPGMKILQFGFGHDKNHVNLPHCFDRNTVVYTGTHDNDTTRGWLSSLKGEQKKLVRSYFGTDASFSAWPLIKSAFSSTAHLAVIPVQDLLDLPSYARFNRPGTSSGNWKWRFKQEQMDRMMERRGDQLKYWHELYGRSGACENIEYSQSPE